MVRGPSLPGVRDTGSGSLGMKSHQLHGQGEAGDRALESPWVFRVARVVWLQQRVCWAGSGEAEAEKATGRGSLVQGGRSELQDCFVLGVLSRVFKISCL